MIHLGCIPVEFQTKEQIKETYPDANPESAELPESKEPEMQENKTIEKVKIAVVGENAAEAIASLSGAYPTAEFVPMKHPPADMPYVFTDPEIQRRKTEADERRGVIVDVPTEPVRPMNRRERRRLDALSRRTSKR